MATQLTLNDGSLNSAGSLLLKTNGTTTAVTIDTSQNMGLGVTPSAWGNSIRVLEGYQTSGSWSIASGGGLGSAMNLSNNAYYDGSNWIYKGSFAASNYYQNAGAHAWRTAASGTAGNAITFTQAMTLDASGNLGIGTSSPSYKLDVVANQNASTISRVSNSTSGTAAYAALNIASDTNSWLYNFSSGYTTSGRFAAGTTLLDVGSANGLGLCTSSASPIVFYTNVTERARIDSSGKFLINTTTNTTGAQLSLSFVSGYYGAGYDFLTGGGNTAYFANFAYTGSSVGTISSSGSSTSYNTSSDYRLKNTIAPMTGALAKVSLLKPCTYKWNADGSDGEGFIAHELAEVVPQAVTGEKDAVDDDGNPQYQGIDTSFLVATLTAALQEMKAIVDAQAARITALEQA